MKNHFNNPIMPGADPFVLLHDGKYYMYCTMTTDKKPVGHNDFNSAVEMLDGYEVYQSEDLQTWKNMGFCLDSRDVMGDKWFWAPEVLYRNGKFYMVYSSEEHIGMAVADSPLGPFKQEEKKWLYEEKAIDGHMFVDDDGTVYLYYVRLHNGNQIYVAKLSEDLLSIDTLYEDCLIKAEEDWETRDCLVAEGPFEKFKGNPILHRNDKFCGVGHHSFTTSKDGKTLICAYHCHDSLESFQPRRFCLNTAQFVPGENGMDELVINGPK